MAKETSEKLHPSLQGWPYRKVFLTGATGLIGGRVLHELVQIPQVEEVLCLTRPSSRHTGRERLAQRLKRDGIKGEKLDRAMLRVRSADGDLPAPTWCLHEADLAWIRNECDLFIHCAASTSFLDEKACESMNVLGVRNMLDVVRGAKKLRRLVHFSTATLCGCLKDRVMKEDESLPQNDNHVFAYTRTKAEAEKILWAEAEKTHLPLLVLRPSITMARGTRDPKQAKLFLWSIVAAAQLPHVPVRREALIDFVTLDFVVNCTMRLIAKGDKLRYNCYHLSAGKRAAVTAGEMYDVACAKSTRDRLPTAVPPEEWNEAHEKEIEEQGLKTLFEAIRLHLPFISYNLIYDNSRVIEELGPDLPELPKFTEYMNEMIATINPELVMMASRGGFGG